ncbi:hypothetical protein [Streptomyces graminilatus]|uniref:hypothetical protein n=1 Tax=Streptomyces graminilatus TaxID=1464070 RepID=UPI000AA7CF0C|nr:hypothetical protein [Streptomyces graminilatus]
MRDPGRAGAAADGPEAVCEARRRGRVISHGAVRPGAHAVAAPPARDGDVLDARVMFVSHRQDRVDEATPEVVSAARAARGVSAGTAPGLPSRTPRLSTAAPAKELRRGRRPFPAAGP